MNLTPGDVIAIPVAGQFGLAKVIYCSEYFKDVVLIRLFKVTYPSLDVEVVPDFNSDADLYYTGADPVRKGLWKKVGFQAVSEAEKLMSKRIVGGDVWVADKHIGPASEQELATLPAMRTFGYRLIEKAVARMLS
jgi:hypothetical protein